MAGMSRTCSALPVPPFPLSPPLCYLVAMSKAHRKSARPLPLHPSQYLRYPSLIFAWLCFGLRAKLGRQ